MDDFFHAAAQVALAGLALVFVKQYLESIFVVFITEEAWSKHQHVLFEVVVVFGVLNIAQLVDPQVSKMLALLGISFVPEVVGTCDEVLLFVVICNIHILVPNSLFVSLGRASSLNLDSFEAILR